MSWINCDHCGALIDTDAEPETYREQKDVWVCNDCWTPPSRDTEEFDDPDGEIVLPDWPGRSALYGPKFPRKGEPLK